MSIFTDLNLEKWATDMISTIGKRKNTIGKIEITTVNHLSRISTKITTNDGSVKELWFSIRSEFEEWFAEDRCDGFVVAILIYSMTRGEDITTTSNMSQKLWNGLTYFYIPLLAKSFPLLEEIKIIPAGFSVDVTKATGVATGFSAGIDSFEVLLSHYCDKTDGKYQVSDLIFNNVGSHLVGDDHCSEYELFNSRLNHVDGCAKEMGIPLVTVNSNISDVFPIDFQKSHHTLNVAVALVLQRKFGKFLYASTYPYESCGVDKTDDIGRFDPMVLHFLSTESIECISVGGLYSRVEKAALVSRYEPARRYLNVCASFDSLGRNCSVCFKCSRTLLTLELLGEIENFAEVFDLNRFKEIRTKYLLKVLIFQRAKSFEREIADLVIQRGSVIWSLTFRVRKAFARLFCN